jgi:hypothetical protein
MAVVPDRSGPEPLTDPASVLAQTPLFADLPHDHLDHLEPGILTATDPGIPGTSLSSAASSAW